MSEQNHTPEPWSYHASIPEDGFECFFINGKSKRISDFDGPQDEEQFANVRRIIYCVNALEGLSDHALIGGWTFRGIEAFAKGLEKQRDELLAALEGARESLDAIRLAVEPYDDIKPRDCKSDRANLRDAHTSAKETIEAVDTAIASVKSNTK